MGDCQTQPVLAALSEHLFPRDGRGGEVLHLIDVQAEGWALGRGRAARSAVACHSEVSTRQPKSWAVSAPIRPFGICTSRILFSAMTARMETGGVAWPTMARMEARAVNWRTLLSSGAMTVACSRAGKLRTSASPAPGPPDHRGQPARWRGNWGRGTGAAGRAAWSLGGGPGSAGPCGRAGRCAAPNTLPQPLEQLAELVSHERRVTRPGERVEADGIVRVGRIEQHHV